MPSGETKFFVSYAREDKEFALKLAKDLRAAGANLWVDQLDIPPGSRWDTAVEAALDSCGAMLLILSPDAVASENVKDEVADALDKGKRVVPVVVRECKIPLRLRRVQYIDFAALGEEAGIAQVRAALTKRDEPEAGQVEEQPPPAQVEVEHGKEQRQEANHKRESDPTLGAMGSAEPPQPDKDAEQEHERRAALEQEHRTKLAKEEWAGENQGTPELPLFGRRLRALTNSVHRWLYPSAGTPPSNWRRVVFGAAVGVILLLFTAVLVAHYPFGGSLPGDARADRLVVEKSAHRLRLMAGDRILKSYWIALGRNDGPKTTLGDGRTPEGRYTIDTRNASSQYRVALHVSYPNETDRQRAATLGASAGGEIAIHGMLDHDWWVGRLDPGVLDWYGWGHSGDESRNRRDRARRPGRDPNRDPSVERMRSGPLF